MYIKKTFAIVALLVMLLVGSVFGFAIRASTENLNDYNSYCYVVGSETFTSQTGSTNTFTEPYHMVCSSNPLPENYQP